MKNNSIKVLVILGPTSSGKSQAAIELAKEFNGEIISADSRQIYKDMDLGTGKVQGQWENGVFICEGILHYLIDFVDPNEQYNVSHFKKECNQLICQIADKGKLPIICGGTGFWISSVVDNMKLPEVKPDPVLRQELSQKTNEQLFEQLSQLDPSRARTVDRKNKVRLIRAIEIAKAIGKVPVVKNFSKQKSFADKILEVFGRKNLPVIKQKFSVSDFDADNIELSTCGVRYQNVEFLQIGISHPKEILEDRIKTRIEQRLEAGMIEEVQNLKDKYDLPWEKIQSFGLGYYWIPLYLQNQISKTLLEEKILIAERGYAKRQRTWFKKDPRIVWENNIEKISQITKQFINK